MVSREHLGGIESLRAYAALLVIVFHVIWLAGFDPPHALEALKWHAGRGVPLFFAVSGFSLAYGYDGRLAGGGLRDFYLRRLFRIAPLYYFACAVEIVRHLSLAWALTHPGQILLAGAFLFNLAPAHVEGIALASWSIGVEMLFYLIFPFVLALARSLTSAVVLVIASVAAALAMVALNGGLSNYVAHSLAFNLPFFAAGIVAYRLYQARPTLAFRPLLLLTVVSVAGLVWAAGPLAGLLNSPAINTVYQSLWSIPIALACLTLASRPDEALSNPATRWLGKVSFSLYLAHPHVIATLKSAHVYDALKAARGGVGMQFLLASAVTVAATALVAWPLHAWIEVPGQALGRGLVRRLNRAPAAKAATAAA
ncbi:acyltransferase family protein [Phenylobacterium aquaticum]|uniref:acyltransferase family protein n=1 Tax=Phenylobacterium aquaticum TaxID=1763816 RepID=UPI001F5CD73D|nr:acyltransferase [Phenylobacterium aquaticum]